MTKQINLDCDGTFVDLYGVENWLSYLLNSDPTPYEIAKPLVNLSSLAKALNKLQRGGYKIVIISWLSKNATADYNIAVTKAKRTWLKKHLPSVKFDEIKIVPYGTPKSQCGEGYLWDDEQKNRTEWENHGGKAFSANTLVKDLWALSGAVTG